MVKKKPTVTIDVDFYQQLVECARALRQLYGETIPSDGLNPNLEGSENKAEERAGKALDKIDWLTD